MAKNKRPTLREYRMYGAQGGAEAARRMTEAHRTARARTAAQTRWQKWKEARQKQQPAAAG
jgi:hypothetical protein